ncbi:MAG: hypothetical protein LBP92_02655 [Deltaproteobacteria bacterium]|nr:hypothetical protein [Deltaproteobacteria bacterium]
MSAGHPAHASRPSRPERQPRKAGHPKPQVSIFWWIPFLNEPLVNFPSDYDAWPDYGIGVVSSGLDHVSTWPGVCQEFADLKDADFDVSRYDQYPRGRVNIRLSRPLEALILASPAILNNPDAVEAIKIRNNLPRIKCVLMIDSHYR